MTIGEPIEEQCVRMFGTVYGNPMQTLDDLRRQFYQQEMSVIAGWERLAQSVSRVTTPATLAHVMEQRL